MSTAKPLQWYDWNRTHPIAKGLVALYPFWAQHGITAFDLVNGNDGSLTNGPTWVEDYLKMGVTEYVESTPGIDTFGFTGLTLALWLRLPNTNNRRIITLGGAGDTSWEHALQYFNDTLEFRVNANAGSLTSFAQALNANQWYHLAVTANSGTTDNLLLFLDGRPAGTPISIAFATLRTTARTQFGRLSQFGNADFDLDSVGIWNRAIDLAEIEELAAKRHLLIQPPVTSVSMYFQAPAPPTGVTVGILHRGQLPGILARAG